MVAKRQSVGKMELRLLIYGIAFGRSMVLSEIEFNIGKWGITPILRVEHVDMYRQNLLALAQNPNINSTEEGREPNVYTQFCTGITVITASEMVNFLEASTKE